MPIQKRSKYFNCFSVKDSSSSRGPSHPCAVASSTAANLLIINGWHGCCCRVTHGGGRARRACAAARLRAHSTASWSSQDVALVAAAALAVRLGLPFPCTPATPRKGQLNCHSAGPLFLSASTNDRISCRNRPEIAACTAVIPPCASFPRHNVPLSVHGITRWRPTHAGRKRRQAVRGRPAPRLLVEARVRHVLPSAPFCNILRSYRPYMEDVYAALKFQDPKEASNVRALAPRSCARCCRLFSRVHCIPHSPFLSVRLLFWCF